ncbi:DUF397 domain-containing protein [Streptomyces anulatus]|uniref:DUF397 domain-containing protein n=1 Tax=Streptomyces anulatus TaxID=1892 RepID=UPI0034104020
MNTDTPAHGPIPENTWVKSSYSDGTGNNCIEVSDQSSTIYVRDSKNKKGPVLALSPQTWASFVGLACSDETN